MKSVTTRGFWDAYDRLNQNEKARARKAYGMWREDPFHPSLHFKALYAGESLWSVRITLELRALGTRRGDTITWFWIGSHDPYMRKYSR